MRPDSARQHLPLRLHRGVVWLSCWGLALVALPTAARATPPDADAAQVRAALERDSGNAGWWFWGWSAGFATASVVQLSLAGTTPSEGFRADTAVGGLGSSLGLIGLAIGTMNPEVEVPADDDLPQLLSALRVQARRERDATGWLPYVLASAVATGAGLYLWLGKDRPLQAGITFGLDLLVGSTQIWTVPTGALDLWEELNPGVDP